MTSDDSRPVDAAGRASSQAGAASTGARPATAAEGGPERRRRRWEEAASLPLTSAAVMFLVAYAVPILAPALPRPWPEISRAVTWATWALFALDYVARLALSQSRWQFVRRNVLDLVVAVLPLLRPLRLLRLVSLLSVVNRYAGGSLRGRVATYVAGSTVLLLGVASLAVLDAERDQPGANITTFGDALWWAMTTVTTVGYGDRYPVTGTGRLVAVGLMLAGVALLGVVTAALASWLVEQVQDVEEAGEAAMRVDVEALAQQIAALRAELANGRLPTQRTTASASSGEPTPTTPSDERPILTASPLA